MVLQRLHEISIEMFDSDMMEIISICIAVRELVNLEQGMYAENPND